MIELIFIAGSIHLDGGDYNEVNPGVIVGYEQVYAGCYDNSFEDLSCLVAYGKEWQITDKISVGGLAGGVTNYEYNWTKNGITAFAAPYISYEIDENTKPTISLMGNALTFNYRVEF